MAIPDSTNTTPRFLEIEPDWRGDILLVQKWITDVNRSWSGAEQRARRREVPRYEFRYQYNAMDLGTYSKRHMAMIKELGAGIVLPIWTHRFEFDSEASDVVTLVTLGRALSKTPFQVGQYAYFQDLFGVLDNTFRLITEIDDVAGTITCEAGTVSYPIGGSVMPYTYAWVWPALYGMRNESSFNVERIRVNQTNEALDFEQL